MISQRTLNIMIVCCVLMFVVGAIGITIYSINTSGLLSTIISSGSAVVVIAVVILREYIRSRREDRKYE